MNQEIYKQIYSQAFESIKSELDPREYYSASIAIKAAIEVMIRINSDPDEMEDLNP